MALTGSVTTADGVVHASAYAKVAVLVLDYIRESAHVEVNHYHDEDTRTANKTSVKTSVYPVSGADFTANFGTANLDTENPVKSAYDYLKTLADFSGWSDC